MKPIPLDVCYFKPQPSDIVSDSGLKSHPASDRDSPGGA